MHCFYTSSSGVRDDGLFEIGDLDWEGYAEIEESDDMVMDEFFEELGGFVRMVYWYDFGDSWMHTIECEKE